MMVMVIMMMMMMMMILAMMTINDYGVDGDGRWGYCSVSVDEKNRPAWLKTS